MAGHSKWANIKHKKAAADSKRGKVFTKMAKLITVAAQQGGGDVDMNASLRTAVQKAKAAGVPNANIDRAIKKGTGNTGGEQMVEMTYEGYGHAGVAIMIKSLTDNNKRTYSSVRDIMNKNGGSLGGSGCVSYLFERKGIIEVENISGDHDEFELKVIDAGAEDIQWNEDQVRILTSPEGFEQVEKVLHSNDVQKAEISFVASDEIEISDVENSQKLLALIEKIEEDDDVDEVFTNASFSEEVLKQC